MTRLFTDGAESGNVLHLSSVQSEYVSASTAQKFTGNYSYLSSTSSSGTASIRAHILLSDVGISEFYFRGRVYCGDFSSQNHYVFAWMVGNTILGSVTYSTTFNFDARVGSTVVKSSSVTYPMYTWNLIEVHVKIHDSEGIIEVKINGILDSAMTFTGDTKPGANTGIDRLGIGGRSIYLDDLAVNDTSGLVDNSWCGDGHVIALTPNANGDSSQLTGSDGNSTDNYLLVDEVPSDGDTTYVESATADQKDLYNLTACGLSNVNILRVWPEAIAKDTTTGAGTVKLVTKTESTEYDSANIDLSTSYTAIKGGEYLVNPNTSAAWTTTQLDALQVGMKVVD